MGPRVIPIPSGAARCCGSRLLRLGPGSPWKRGFIAALAGRLARFDWSTVEHDVLKVLYEIGHFRINAKGAGRVLHARLAGQCHGFPR